MIPHFFYGTLCHRPLLRVVVGRDPGGVGPAALTGHVVHWARDRNYPVIHASPDGRAEGLLVEDITADEAARLDFYEGGFGYACRDLTVDAGGRQVGARVYLPLDPLPPGAPWNLDDWAGLWGPVAAEAAAEMIALKGSRDPRRVFARYPQILVRAAARIRAAHGGPISQRRQAVPGDVEIVDWRQPYASFFAVEETDLRFRRFDGGFSDPVTRAVFISGDAATVLPYDPVRDRVLLIEQFRAGPHARGDVQPWLLEAIAGRVDADETPQEAARREAQEEAGVKIGELVPVGSYYPSPGGKSEYIYSYIGIADLPDSLAGGVNGMADEHEDIRTHLIPFDRLMELVESGEGANAPLIISALGLARLRDRLRRPA